MRVRSLGLCLCSVAWFVGLTAQLAVLGAEIDFTSRTSLLTAPVSPKLGGDTARSVATFDSFTFIAANADDQARAMFSFGNQVFTAEWTPSPGPQPATDGLGPIFNTKACSDCHINNGRGQSPTTSGERMDSALVRLSVPGQDPFGGPNPVPNYGDQLQDRAIEGVRPEGQVIVHWDEQSYIYGDGTQYSLRKPRLVFRNLAFGDLPAKTMSSLRVASPVIGLGLLELVPEETLLALADPDDNDRDEISGRINIVWDAQYKKVNVGRFGWKANVPSLALQNAGAARGDMGITTPLATVDNCEEIQEACKASATHNGVEMSSGYLQRLNTYVRYLAVPSQRGAQFPEVQRGQALFNDTGCSQCHVPTLVSGSDSRAKALSNQTFHPFTDLLLHDMGEGLADDRPDFLASGKEWRTPPLWGIGLTKKVSGHSFFLHDGRARNLEEAILWHGGEAETSKETFRNMKKNHRDDLIAFLGSL